MANSKKRKQPVSKAFAVNIQKFFSDNLKSAILNPKWLRVLALICAFVTWATVAMAQQPAKVWRIAWVTAASLSPLTARLEAFRQGLRELGYVEGKNIIIDVRSAEGKLDRLPALISELVSLNVDVIVSGGPAVTRAAKQATSTIPIVMGFDLDPVGSGFVASLARPGGNITGLSTLAPELSGKRLELLKETVSKLSRVAVFATSTQPGNAQMLKEVELAAGVLKLRLQNHDVLNPKEVELAFGAAVNERAGAVLWLVSGAVAEAVSAAAATGNRKKFTELAVKNQLPVIYEFPTWVEDGGLMSYGINLIDLDRRAATYVDKIIKGRTPADLPVEQPMKFDFIVNLPAAKKIGLTIPPNVLVRANRVIR